jgi:hypothetical protein
MKWFPLFFDFNIATLLVDDEIDIVAIFEQLLNKQTRRKLLLHNHRKGY